MKKRIIQTVCLFTMLVSSPFILAQEKGFRCHIKGKVIDRPYSKSLVLVKEGGDPRVSDILIPIKEGAFDYVLETDMEESYSLIFNDELEAGVMRSFVFFIEPGIVQLTLHPMEQYHLNKIEGGALNHQHNTIKSKKDSLFKLNAIWQSAEALQKENKYYSEEVNSIRDRISKEQDPKIIDSLRNVGRALPQQLSPEADSILKAGERQYMKQLEWEREQLVIAPSLVTYRLLLEQLRMAVADERMPQHVIPNLIGVFEQYYRPVFPTHSYTKSLEELITSQTSIKKGGKYIDFTAPDFNDTPVTLSAQIQGKVALINLWASWCGPCRRKSLDIVPIYEAFKDKGFVVVGVARERNKADGEKAVEKDGYPWLNLLELQDKAGIWNKYGIGNSGGALFLVDRDGTILAVSPTAEEINDLLQKIL